MAICDSESQQIPDGIERYSRRPVTFLNLNENRNGWAQSKEEAKICKMGVMARIMTMAPAPVPDLGYDGSNNKIKE